MPQVPLGESFARLNDYPDGTYRELREAAAAYAGVDPEQIVPGAGADGLIALAARTFLGPGRLAFVQEPTYPVYAVATGIEGAASPTTLADADLVWVCNPNNPTGELVEPDEIAALARSLPARQSSSTRRTSSTAAKTVAPLVAGTPNLIALRTLSKAFGLAALRVGYAIASPDVARELDRRRDPAPVSAPSRASPPLRSATRGSTSRRRSPSASGCATACSPPASTARRRPGTSSSSAAPTAPTELEAQGLVVRRRRSVPDHRSASPPRTTGSSPRSAPPRAPPPGVRARCPTTAETALRIGLDLDGRAGRARRHRDRLPRPPALPTRFPRRSRPRGLAGGDLDVDDHHTVEDVIAALGDALAQALDGRRA